ncbi:MAG: hypothetical protein Ct9H300mP7_1520 [Verrucomicrobiota bacterium]|nr:MAG: hypothetical protein Ct9H300mP7_1520 [Verrucomicrobiota bacterium]
MGEQQNYYRENEEYADFLEGWDPRVFMPSTPTHSARTNPPEGA